MVRGALCALTIGLVAAVGALAFGSAERADYGDAPDGRQGGYVQRGEFPSLFRSNGARARDTSYVHLGRDATTELDSLQVNNDRRDDGVFVRLVQCQQSEARVIVTLPTAGQPNRGTAFLNLFFDWNRDGRWRGVDRRCGGQPPPEWTVRNFRINLSAQDAREQVYRVRFRGGSFVGSMWFRAVLSVGQPMRDPSGRGAFARGEVEDYVYANSPTAQLTCFAQGVEHGKEGNVVISPFVPGLRIRSARLLLTQPATPERVISREATVAPNGLAATFTYRSLKVDARPNPVPVDTFSALVRTNQDGALRGRRVDCSVLVQHEQKPEGTPPPQPPPPPPAPTTYRYSFLGPITVTFNGPAYLERPLVSHSMLEGSACGTDPTRAVWAVRYMDQFVPDGRPNLNLGEANPTPYRAFRYVLNDAETGKVTISLRIAPTTASVTTEQSGDISNLSVSPAAGVPITRQPVPSCP